MKNIHNLILIKVKILVSPFSFPQNFYEIIIYISMKVHTTIFFTESHKRNAVR